jgi:hypothetical protein
MKRIAITIVAATLLVAGCSKSSSNKAASSAGGASPGAASSMPEMASSALGGIESAFQSGRASAIESVFSTKSSAQKALVDASAKLSALKNTVEKSIKFNAPSSSISALVNKIAPTGGIIPTLQSLKNSSVVVNGESAVVNQGKNLSKIFLSKVGGNWKIDLQKTISAVYPDASTAQSKLQSLTANLGKATQFLQQVQAGLANGSIKSMSDIETLAAKFEAGNIPGASAVKGLMGKL